MPVQRSFDDLGTPLSEVTFCVVEFLNQALVSERLLVDGHSRRWCRTVRSARTRQAEDETVINRSKAFAASPESIAR